jgi:hypothetical protein
VKHGRAGDGHLVGGDGPDVLRGGPGDDIGDTRCGHDVRESLERHDRWGCDVALPRAQQTEPVRDLRRSFCS